MFLWGETKEKMYYILLERVLIDKVFWFRNVMLTIMILYLGTVFWCVCWCDTSCACGVLVGDHMVLSRVCSGATRCVDVPATRYRWSVATQTPPNPHLTQSHAFHKAHTNFIFSSTSQCHFDILLKVFIALHPLL